MKAFFPSLILIFLPLFLDAQTATLQGQIRSQEDDQAVAGATVFLKNTSFKTTTDAQGFYKLKDLDPGRYTLAIFAFDRQTYEQSIQLEAGKNRFDLRMNSLSDSLSEITVEASQTRTFGMSRLNSVDGYGIYEAKKNEVIVLDDLSANKAANNARQIFARVPGLNIWESDCAGIQLDIAARGLGPSRTANFNTRQNGYDMSADALGYPESYYTPPMQAVERIEIVRGAASLQYGTQFGGMLNFVLKEAPRDKKFEFNTEQTYGSFNFFNSFNSAAGTIGKFNYYTYYQYKRGDCWRPNSGFDLHNAHARLGYEVNDRLSLSFEYSFMYYQAQQPGGLLDAEFERDPRQSKRERNWFKVNWNLAAFTLDYRISDRTRLNVRTFGLLSSRDALGNLERIDRIDFLDNRDLIHDEYKNFGNETRLIHRYNFLKKSSVLLLGFRYYQGFTLKQQGDANDGSGPDFEFLNPDDVEVSDFDFPSRNYAFFAENIFNITDKFSITPGIRIEHIRTFSDGYFKERVFDGAGNLITESTQPEETSTIRSFPLLGLGLSYKFSEDWELYGNFSQNYRSVTFSDLRIDNPNFVLDPNIKDENGYNLDLGTRGSYQDWLNFDISLFYLRYNDRIGFLLLANQPPLFLDFRFNTNVGDSRHYGLESFIEMDLMRFFAGKNRKIKLAWFTNFSYINAEYVNSQRSDIVGRKVEYVPEFMLRTGLTFRNKNLQATWQFSSLSEQFSDATNAERAPGAVSGIIPSYYVMDFSLTYKFKFLKVATGVNNLTDERYFTRRADSYPGPGIIPAAGRSFYLTLGATL